MFKHVLCMAFSATLLGACDSHEPKVSVGEVAYEMGFLYVDRELAQEEITLPRDLEGAQIMSWWGMGGYLQGLPRDKRPATVAELLVYAQHHPNFGDHWYLCAPGTTIEGWWPMVHERGTWLTLGRACELALVVDR